MWDGPETRDAGGVAIRPPEPAPRTARISLTSSFARYVAVGLISVAIDFAALYLLHSGAHVVLWLATVLAYAFSVVVNYSLNHNWSFASERSHRQAMIRYGVLLAVNVGLTLGLVLGLTALGAFYLLAKLVAVCVNGLINFTGFRYWVFG